MNDEAVDIPEPWLTVDEDPLTGLPNMIALVSDLSRSEPREGTAIGFDVSDLRSINHDRGRSAGDEVLIALAQCLRKAASATGSPHIRLYRMGGDEFLAIICDSKECAEFFLHHVLSDREAPAFHYTSVAFPPEGEERIQEPFTSIWLPVEKGLLGLDFEGDPKEHIISRLVSEILDTVNELKTSRQMAYTDDISGLPNQRAARYLLRAHLDKHRDTGKPVSLLFIDGDNLRMYNDCLGYAAGNEMIRKLGAVISGATLPGELVSRWLSGDEFMVILPNVDKKGALARADRICNEVIVKSSGWPYPITVSIGVVTFPDDGRDIEELLAEVERANGKAKNLGKNRACSLDGPQGV